MLKRLYILCSYLVINILILALKFLFSVGNGKFCQKLPILQEFFLLRMKVNLHFRIVLLAAPSRTGNYFYLIFSWFPHFLAVPMDCIFVQMCTRSELSDVCRRYSLYPMEWCQAYTSIKSSIFPVTCKEKYILPNQC